MKNYKPNQELTKWVLELSEQEYEGDVRQTMNAIQRKNRGKE